MSGNRPELFAVVLVIHLHAEYERCTISLSLPLASDFPLYELYVLVSPRGFITLTRWAGAENRPVGRLPPKYTGTMLYLDYLRVLGATDKRLHQRRAPSGPRGSTRNFHQGRIAFTCAVLVA